VIRALLGWGIVVFAILQVYEPVMHGLHLPEWTLTLVILLLAAGFPVTLLLAWVFDIGPAGIERTDSRGRTTTIVRAPGPASRGSQVHVRLVEGEAQPAEARFPTTFLFGRAPDCDVRVQEPFVSRRHLQVRLDGVSWWLKDLGTGSGTYVAGSPIREAPLEGAVEVEIGKGGPRFSLVVEREQATRVHEAATSPPVGVVGSETEVIRRYIAPEPGTSAGKQTLMFRRAYQRVLQRSTRRYRLAVVLALLALLGAGGVILYQARSARPPGAPSSR
jgi:hypothetical protein